MKKKMKLVPKKKASVVFSDIATLKINALVSSYTTEVAWHCTASRIEGKENSYYVEDVLVYPQTVTGVTVTTDQEKYSMWLMNHEDEVFNKIRFQGHSHVNMGVNPSGTDQAFYKSIKDQMSSDMFYIFMIINKRWEMYFEIVDDTTESIFHTKDVVVEYEGFNPVQFLDDCRELVVEKKKSYTKTYGWTDVNKKSENTTKKPSYSSIENYWDFYCRDYYDDWNFAVEDNHKKDTDDFSFIHDEDIPF